MAGGQGGWLTDLAADAVRQAGVRGVVQAVWADLEANSGDVHVVGDLPHDWLFPRMSAVVHHGGAGTTAAGMRAGVPTVVTPVYADQPLGGARVHALGVGPAPLPLRRLTASRLAAAIRDAVDSPGHRDAAAALSARIATEDGVAPVVRALRALSA